MAGRADVAVEPAPVPDLPASSLREALPYLRRPFTPEAVKFKVQASFKEATGGIIVAYIDARLVIERLNLVVGDAWTADYGYVDGNRLMWCNLRVFDTVRRDVGESAKGMSKDLVSDALKRAAVQFGVGVSIYALPQITLWMRESQDRIEVREVWDAKANKKKKVIALTEHGHAKLREGYATWLEEKNLFGAPLDHGDVEGQTVDPEAEEAEAFVPEAPAALEDEKAKLLVTRCKSAYSDIREIPKGIEQIPPGMFAGWLQGAAHSHAELERLAVFLEARRDELAS
jgi:hypothetical protein